MLVENNPLKRRPGRPRAFQREAALDRAVELFWENGYDGVDVDRIAHAVGVTKPSLYRMFGDKPSLFLKAVQRYGETYGLAARSAFEQEPDITKAVSAFCEAAVRMATSEGGRTGCLAGCAAAGHSDRAGDVRASFSKGLSAMAEALARRFEREVGAGRLSADVPALVRGKLLVDLMQGIALRARAGVSRKELLKDTRSYVPLVLR